MPSRPHGLLLALAEHWLISIRPHCCINGVFRKSVLQYALDTASSVRAPAPFQTCQLCSELRMVCHQELEMILGLVPVSTVGAVARKIDEGRKMCTATLSCSPLLQAAWGDLCSSSDICRGDCTDRGESFISTDGAWKPDPGGSQYVGGTWWVIPGPKARSVPSSLQ